jgi:hypothetical protein
MQQGQQQQQGGVPASAWTAAAGEAGAFARTCLAYWYKRSTVLCISSL